MRAAATARATSPRGRPDWLQTRQNLSVWYSEHEPKYELNSQLNKAERTAGGALLGPGRGEVKELVAALQGQRAGALARQLLRGHARHHAQAVP